MSFPQRIPTLLGLFFVVALIGGLMVLSQNILPNPSQASAAHEPIDLVVTNITDTSFTVTWLTSDPATGLVEIATPIGKTTTIFDERDQTGKLGKYTTHSATIRSLSPNTNYTFSVISDGKHYLKNGAPYRIATPNTLSGATNLEPAYGNVVTVDTQPAYGALVYLTLDGGQTLSAIVRQTGSWMIPLNLTRNSDLSTLILSQERISEDLTIVYDGKTSAVTADTLNDSPMPQITIGQSYDFRRVQALAPTPATIAQLQTAPGILGAETVQSAARTISIVAPADNGTIPSAVPNVYGTGIPGTFVAITLGITKPVVGGATVGPDGIWRFTPAMPLGIGRQSITITTKDEAGKVVAMTNMFDIMKSGTQVLGDATPSGSLVTPTTEVTLEPTPIPEITGEPVPVTGSATPLFIVTIVGLLTLAAGAMLGLR